MTPIGVLITAIGLLATLVARRGVAVDARRGGVAEHLRRVFTLIALLLAFRLMIFASAAPLLVAALMVIASWMPLATLRLGEELVRRHAPRPLKFAALGGAMGFSLVAATLGLMWTREAILALAAFQALVIGAVTVHIFRHRYSVSPAERRMADMLVLAFALCLPLLATDFEQLFPALPFRGGAFAALVFVLACSRLATDNSRPSILLADIAIAAGAGGLGALAAKLAGASPGAIVAIAACSSASAGLVLLIGRFEAGGRPDNGILSSLTGDVASVEAALSSHPLLSTGVPLGPGELADLPDGLAERLAGFRVITGDGIAGDEGLNGAARELLDRYSATHLLTVSRSPARFLAISGGALNERKLSAELDIVGRLLERMQ